ncbi:hypothetical protein DL768_010174 [Monosporascus sp. mg162]|nr:hypothetical protein DL768_010174 [Monosporascus sp. mg162]
MMDLGSALVLLVAGAIAVTYLWLSALASRQKPKDAQPEPQPNSTRQPLEVLYPEPTDDTNKEAEVDIIAVHGLGSNVDWSWTWKDGDKRVNWLRDPDMLPAKVTKSRIIAYNYESRWHAAAPKTRLQLCGEDLIHGVHSFRGGPSDRPIVFVGHSLGGNVIVHGLLHANNEDKYKYLPEATVGLVFLGTPFRGTKWQPFANSVAQLTRPAGSHSGIIRELNFDEPMLLDKLHSFCRLRNGLSTPISCFNELYETDYGQRFGIGGVARGMIGSPIITDSSHALTKRPEARDCLRDLFLTDPSEDRNELKRKKGGRAPGTCEWILGTEELTAWLGSGQTADPQSWATYALWLYGNPGTGKSTMAIFLTEELSMDFSATDGKTLAYFFCDSGFDTRKTATSVVRGLLLQLVQQHPQLLDYLLPKYNERGAKLFESFDALWTIFMAAVADQNTGRKYCIIDALDECDRESQKTLLRQFQETFRSGNITSNIRILITSRPYSEIREYLGQFTNKDLGAFPETKRDIGRYIEEKVTDLAKRKSYTDKTKGQVRNILKNKAEGTFLWVGLACGELEGVPSKDAARVLQNMPEGLHSLYKKLLDTALEQEGGDPDVIRRILSFVAVCLRPLGVLELAEACQLHQEEDDVKTRVQFTREQIAACRSIVIIQDEKVLLLHQSVKDYLVGPGSGHFIDELEAHAHLAYRCVDILIEQFRGGKQSRVGFAAYATRDWANHARTAQTGFKIRNSQAEFFETNSLWAVGSTSVSGLCLSLG